MCLSQVAILLVLREALLAADEGYQSVHLCPFVRKVPELIYLLNTVMKCLREKIYLAHSFGGSNPRLSGLSSLTSDESVGCQGHSMHVQREPEKRLRPDLGLCNNHAQECPFESTTPWPQDFS